MRQVLIQGGNVRVEQVPAPLLEDGHVLVEVAFSLISAGTEISGVEKSSESLLTKALRNPDKVLKLLKHLKEKGIQKSVALVQSQTAAGGYPTGYSCAGIVLQVGAGVDDVQPGDWVACAGAGIANHADIVLVPRNLLVKVPPGCDLKAAASVTLGAIAMQGVRRADPRLGDMVAVIGLGLLGQIVIQLLKAAGCRVVGFDIDLRRVALARELGADNAFVATEVDPATEVRYLTADHGVDATIITASSPSHAIINQAMALTRKKGKVVVVGDVGLGVQRSPFYEKEIDLLISCSYGPGRYDSDYEEKGIDYPYAYVRWTENRNMTEYLRLVASGQVKTDPILEREYDLGSAPEAYESLRTGNPRPLGVVLKYPLESPGSGAGKLASKLPLQSRTVSGKVRIAVVGAGNFAKQVHLPNLQALDSIFDLRAVVSGTGSNAKAVAARFGAEYAGTNFAEVLDDAEVDAVLLCTRHHLHASMTLQALQAGKHVLVEKPLALTAEELAAIKNHFESKADQAHPVLLTGFNRRFSPYARAVHELVQHRSQPMMLRYRMNAGHIAAANWVQGPEGGGRNLGEACHIYDLFTYLTNGRAVAVQAQSIAPGEDCCLRNENFVADVSFADGSVASLAYTSMGSAEYPKECLEVFVEGKVFVIDDYQSLKGYGAKVTELATSAAEKGHREELQAFGEAVQKGTEPPIPFWQQAQATEIALAVESQLRGQE